MTRTLDHFLLDSAKLDEELLAEKLKPFLHGIDRKTGASIFKPAFSNLSSKDKILCFLLTRKVAILLDVLDKGKEAVSPSEIEDETGMPGGTIRPALQQLKEERVVEVTGGKYNVPNYGLRIIHLQEEKAPVNRSSSAQSRGTKIKSPKSKKTRRIGRRSESYKIVEINLKDLAEFYKGKSPSTFKEINVVFIYYLKKILKIENVTPDHIYTCYRYLHVLYPKAFKQSLYDTASRKDWIDTNSIDDIDITIIGERFVEHELPVNSKQ